jgi:hypothetical protein
MTVILRALSRIFWGVGILSNKHLSAFAPRVSGYGHALLAVLLVLAFPHIAFAQEAESMSDVLCYAFDNSVPFGRFCQWGAYISGCILIVQGIHHFRLHTENPTGARLNTPVMMWLGAMFLMSLPTFCYTVISSIYGAPTAGGGMTCTAGSPTSGAATLDTMLTNFVGNIYAPMLSLVSLIAILCGLFMIVRGLMKASKYGVDPRTHSISSILSNIVFGGLLVTIGDNLTVMLASVFGTSAVQDSSVINWANLTALAGGNSTEFQNALTAALQFVQIIGFISFVRGWLIMKKVVEGGGQATMAQGITHIVGGAFAINIFQMLVIFDNTLGTGLF